MKTRHLEAKRTLLLSRREQLISRFEAAARRGKSTSRLSSEIDKVNDFLASLEQIVAENTRTDGQPRRYAVSSLFLHDCFKKLTADKYEQFFFVTGAEVDGVFVLDQCAEFAHQRRTAMGVVAEIPATHDLLIKLEQFGHKFLAHFHSHPGTGPDATHPSGIDENFQRRLEKAGHIALMGVFSRDGYIRFVRLDGKFELNVYGEGVEHYAPGMLRLKKVN